MATTVTQSNYWMLKLTSDTTPVFNFKFVIEVYIDSVKQITLKQPKNTNGSAHVSYEKIMRDYIEVTHKHSNTITGNASYDSIHLMPQNATVQSGIVKDYPMSENTGTMKSVTFKFFEEYSTTLTGVISRSASSATDLTLRKINFANEWEDQMNFDTDLYCFNDARAGLGYFLTKLPTVTSEINTNAGFASTITSLNDYKTLSWLNSDEPPFDTQYGTIAIKFYEEAPKTQVISNRGIQTNYVGQITFINNATNGGHSPSSATTDSESLIYLGVGGGNVKNIVYPSRGGYQMGSNVNYYTVFYGESNINEIFTNKSGDNIKPGDFITIWVAGGTIDYTTIGAADNNQGTSFYATGTPSGTGTFKKTHTVPLSRTHLFEVSRCNKYEEFSLAWKNKFGTWDYYMFDGKSSESIGYDRKEFVDKLPGTWDAVNFDLNSYERGRRQIVEGSKSTTVSTRFITEDYNDYFNELMMSNEVILLTPVDEGDDGVKQVPVPINIKDKSIEYKTTVNDKLVQYSFTFEYAHKLKTRN